MVKIPLSTGHQVRQAARSQQHNGPTAGLAPGYIQANLIVLPSKFASDFRSLCQRNPVPCPLLAESTSVGQWDAVESAVPHTKSLVETDLDLRRDIGQYAVYHNGELTKSGCRDIVRDWTDDHVAFLIGCSFSFETALCNAGLAPPHVLGNCNVPMYRTTLPLNPAGVFTGGTYVVSLRAYRAVDMARVREITSHYHFTHGEPIAWGWDAVERLGIKDISCPEWGDAPRGPDGKGHFVTGDSIDRWEVVPVFWGCGVTPQEAVMKAKLEGTVMAHMPGHMLLLDCLDSALAL